MNLVNKQAEKVVLVTGAARRIGKAIAQYLHEQGFNIALHCHLSLKEASVLVASLNALRPESARLFQQDLAASDADKLIPEVLAWSGRLDLLVNNASLFLATPSDGGKIKDWENLFAVNVRAPFLLSHKAFDALAHVKGSIINITDIHAQKPLRQYAVYCQTKAALAMQTLSLAKEFAPLVRVNAVAPGAIAWPEHENTLTEAQRQHIISKTPLKMHGAPVFIAQAVLCLAQNAFITGQTLRVDGGRSII